MSAPAESLASQIMRTRLGVVTHLTPKSLTGESALKEFRSAVDSCIAARENRLVLDLSALSTVNSASLETVLDIQDQLLRTAGWLKIAHANALVREILQLTGLTQNISVIESESSETGSQPGPLPSGAGYRLGDILVSRGLITRERLEEALGLQEKLGKRLGQIIIDKGWVSDQDVLRALADQLSVPYVRLRSGLYDPDVVTLLDREIARRLRVLPLFRIRGVLTLATDNPQAMPTLREVEEMLGCSVRPALARKEDILKSVEETLNLADISTELISDVDEDFQLIESTGPSDHSTIDEIAAGSPVINLVNSLIQRAVRDGASDIHIEPFRSTSRIRFRIDGVLYEIMTPRSELHPALVSRLKVMANLDIAERRLPQDGRIQVYTHGRSVDLRFSSLPGLHGEKVVLRVLDKNQAILDLDKLAMSEDNLNTYKRLLTRGFGLILVTGPTGSGKTTSLYAALDYLNSLEKSIVTIEDPVEYEIAIVNQNEVREKVGLTFAKMLKHVLRQDPDIVMVGEIRERETAEIAVQAALTGHLVLSTLHTNDSVGAITRMIEMGVEPYLLSSALVGVIAQRLVRTICPACTTTFVAAPELVSRYGLAEKI